MREYKECEGDYYESSYEARDMSEFSKLALTKYFEYEILFETISEEWVDPDSLSGSGDVWNLDCWIILQDHNRFGLLVFTDASIDYDMGSEFERCETFEDIVKVINDLCNQIIWCASKEEMQQFLKSETVKTLPHFYSWKHKHYDDFKQKDTEYKDFLDTSLEILEGDL